MPATSVMAFGQLERREEYVRDLHQQPGDDDVSNADPDYFSLLEFLPERHRHSLQLPVSERLSANACTRQLLARSGKTEHVSAIVERHSKSPKCLLYLIVSTKIPFSALFSAAE
jgi:hypothetical protein